MFVLDGFGVLFSDENIDFAAVYRKRLTGSQSSLVVDGLRSKQPIDLLLRKDPRADRDVETVQITSCFLLRVHDALPRDGFEHADDVQQPSFRDVVDVGGVVVFEVCHDGDHLAGFHDDPTCIREFLTSRDFRVVMMSVLQ